MPSIPLDTKHWIKVQPGAEDESFEVTPRGFACYYSNNAEPPEKASEGTEAGVGTGVLIEVPRWFRAKEPGSTEAPVQPSILEVSQAPGPEGEGVSTAMLDKEAVTTEKIKLLNVTTGLLAASAVTGAKITAPSWKAIGSASAELEGAAGFDAAQSAAIYNGLAVLRGASKIKAAGSLAAGAKLFTLNAESKPSKERLVSFALIKKAKEGKASLAASINTSGEVFTEGAIGAEEIVAYDGVVFSL